MLERRHPSYPGFDIPGTVTVVVIPDTLPKTEEGHAPRPLPNQDLLDRVARELNKLRTVGTEVFVTAPRYKQIDVRVTIVPADGVSDAEAKEGVKRAISDFLSPLPRPAEKPATALPGATVAPTRKRAASRYPNGWPFGEPFYPGQLYEVILSAADEQRGVRLVRNVANVGLSVDGSSEWPLGNTVHFDEEPDSLPACTVTVDIDNARMGGRS